MFAKAAAMLCENLPCGLSGSSLSSDIATQVTCIVLHNAQVSFHLRMLSLVSSFLEVLFFFSHQFVFLSSPSLFDTSVSGTSVPGRVSVKSSSLIFYLNFLFKSYKFRYTIVSQRVSAKPTA